MHTTSWMRGWVGRLAVVGLLGVGAAAPAWAQSAADMSVQKTGPGTAAAGSDVTYTVSVLNVGPDDAISAEVDDNTPAGMTFVSVVQTAGPTFSCTTPTVGGTGTVACTIATLPTGASATFSITFNIPMGTAPGTLFTNTATAFSSTPDQNPENDSATAGTQVPGQQADVAIAKSGPSSVAANSDIAYTISVTNAGPNDATNVSWTDTLPAPLTFVSFAQNSGPAFNCGMPGATTTCTIASLAAGASATFTLTGNVPGGTGSGTTITNTASVTSDADPNPENDSATTSATVASADLGVTKSGPASAIAGTAYSYTLTLANAGPDVAQAARFDDTLPAGLTFVSLAQNSGPSGNCLTPPPGAGGSIGCSWPQLFNGQTATFTLTVMPDPALPSGTVVTNTVTAHTSSVDANPNNDTSSAATTVTTQTDVGVTKSAPASMAAGSNLTYTLSVTNNAASSASNVSLSDTLPPGETFVSLTQTSGPAFACSTGATVTCSAATLAGGASATFALVATIGSGVVDGTVLTNTATVTTSTPDTNPGNNTASAATTVQATADLTLTKTGAATATPGANLSYTLALSNAGPSAAANVNVTDTLPAGETFVSLTQTSGTAFTCTTPAVGAGGTVSCTLASLAPNTGATFSLVVAIAANAPLGTQLTNSASASSSTADANGANNASSASATVAAAAPPEATPALDARALWLLIALVGATAAFGRRRSAG